MLIDMKEFERLKKEAERLRREADKAQGALEQTMAILKEEYECDTIEEAKEKAGQHQQEANKLKVRFEKAEKAFRERWGDVLDGGR